jgi:hypothetical protein
MGQANWPANAGISQSETEDAVTAALQAQLADAVVVAEFHDAASVGINGSAGAWVALGSGAALGAAVKKIQMTQTVGEPLEFGTGANAGAATRKWVSNRGEGPQVFEVDIASGTKLWVRSLTTSAVAAGEITLNCLG